MQWVLGHEIINEFDQALIFFESSDGAWTPFIRVVHSCSRDEAIEAGHRAASDLGGDVLVFTLEQAQALAQDTLDHVLRAAVYGPCDYLEYIH